MGLGGLIFMIGWIWLMVVAFKEGGIIWAIVIFFFGWLGGLIFAIVHKTGWIPWIVMVLGTLLAAGGIIPTVLSNLENLEKMSR